MVQAKLPTRCNRCPFPDTAKRCSPRVKNVHGIEFLIYDDTGRRYPANPALSPLPGTNSRRIIDADRPVVLDDAPPAFGGLPFQGVARQGFGRSSLPDIAPE